MGLFGNRYKKIKRNDVVNSIIELQKEQDKMLEDINLRSKEVNEYLQKGCQEKDKNMQLFLAKSISNKRRENAMATHRLQYIMSNISVLEQLKASLDDRDFILNNSKMPLNKMLTNPSELKKFLNSITNIKMVQEEKLAQNLQTFEEIENEYVENDEIYGESQNTNDILAYFERGEEMGEGEVVEPVIENKESIMKDTVTDNNDVVTE